MGTQSDSPLDVPHLDPTRFATPVAEGPVVDATTPAASPTRVGPGFITVLCLANFGIWIALLAPITISLQLKTTALVATASQRPAVIGIMLTIGSVFGVVVNPIAGRLSDRTTSRFGMRRPWLLAGGLICLVGGLTVGFAPAVPVMVVGWIITMIGLNTSLAVLLAILPDQVPVARRGTVSGALGIAQSVGGLLGTGLAFALSRISLELAFIVPAVIAIVTLTIAVVALKDRHLTKEEVPPFRMSMLFGSFWVNPFTYRDFGWAWISRFINFLAIGAVSVFTLFYLQSQVHLSASKAAALIPVTTLVQVVTIILFSAIAGAISDRLSRRKIFVVMSSLLAMVGLILMAFATSIPVFLVATALIGMSQAVYFAVDLALMTDIMPNRERDAGKGIGIFNLANSLPQLIAPALAPLLLSVPLLSVSHAPGQNYTFLFLVGAAIALVAALSILKVRGVR